MRWRTEKVCDKEQILIKVCDKEQSLIFVLLLDFCVTLTQDVMKTEGLDRYTCKQ